MTLVSNRKRRKYAIMGYMRTLKLEPGLVQVFRVYAWLRFGYLFALPFAVHFQHELEYQANYTVQLVVILFDVLLLLAYLYLPGLQKRLGRYFFPLGLALATAMLLIEPSLFPLGRNFFRFNPYFFILLILIAWQYSYREVLIFALLTATIDIILNWIAPPDIFIKWIAPGVGSPPFLAIPLSPLAAQNGANLFVVESVFAVGLVISRTLSFLVLGYVVTRLSEAQRQQHRALAEANQKLVSHATTLEQLAISRERLRLSRELHDTLAHTLSALAVQFDALTTVWEPAPDRARQMLEQMQESTRSGLEETRRALSALRAAPLEEMGLPLALRTLAEDFAARHAWSLEIDIPDSLDDMAPEVEQCFYRVAQEALENAARHAGANNLAVRLLRNPEALTLTIQDDGRGFDPQQTLNGYPLGLEVMRERAELIGAVLTIHSQAETGTRIQLTLERGA
jgi:signal transduction histidine kinase